MDLQEIKDKKAELEKKIDALVKEYEDVTDVRVKHIFYSGGITFTGNMNSPPHVAIPGGWKVDIEI